VGTCHDETYLLATNNKTCRYSC